jgi:hypothetical protein
LWGGHDEGPRDDHLFISPSFGWLRAEIERLVRRFGINSQPPRRGSWELEVSD